eukprot:1898239-Amphidinium_carterae.1
MEGIRYGVPLWSQLAAQRGEPRILLPALTPCQVIGAPVHGAGLPGGPRFTLLRLQCSNEMSKVPPRLQNEIARDDACVAWRTLQFHGDDALRTQDVGTLVDALARSPLPMSDHLCTGLGHLCSRL